MAEPWDEGTDEFAILPAGGGFIKAKDHLGCWVLFVVHGTAPRIGAFGPETVASVDFCNLDRETALTEGLQISAPNVVKHFAAGQKIIGKIESMPSKKPGMQPAIILTQTPGPDYQAAAARARAALGNAPNPAPVAAPAMAVAAPVAPDVLESLWPEDL